MRSGRLAGSRRRRRAQETKALLEREKVDEDRRNHLIRLSDAAQALVPELAQLDDQNADEICGHLPAQVRTAIFDAMKNVVAVHGLKNAPIE
ncbi:MULTISPECIES: hypothetical protein [Paraburkholderia]|uniref:hypothetical protein n=1 Tax=Paraburkholderia TaxID=1822464 RepID=UPI00035FDF60|nr:MULTISPECIES: hypothetical protein [Paraburkholderia]MDH6151598.1 DNA-binding MarR family transcriptional regulator [Paraburkholderia sp. WSM4179]